jgi:hypothetical protein
MRFSICVLLGLLTIRSSGTGQDIVGTVPLIACNVTTPIDGGPVDRTEPGVYGTKQLAFFGPWTDGTVVFKPGGPGFVLPDGSLSMKFGWQRGVRGVLAIDGRRLDAAAPPLRAYIPSGYGDIGFQATALIFPTPGCWEVTGHVGTASLTFTTRVVKVGEGPARMP